MRKIHLLLISSTLLCSGWILSAQAADLEGDMLSLSSGLSTVLTSDQGHEIEQALSQMRHAAQDAQKATPPSLAGSAPQSAAMQAWRSHFDLLLQRISDVDLLVKQGKLSEAKQSAQQIVLLRNQGHRQYR